MFELYGTGMKTQQKKKKKKKNCLFVTYTVIQSITSSEMCSLHLTHPRAHTPGAVGTHTHTPGVVDTHTHTHTWSSGHTHTHTPGAVDTHTHLEQWTHTHTPGAVGSQRCGVRGRPLGHDCPSIITYSYTVSYFTYNVAQ